MHAPTQFPATLPWLAKVGVAMSLLTMLLHLAGCAPKPAAGTPGPNLTLAYPVILFSQQSLNIRVKEDAEALTTTRILQQTDLEEASVIDANGTHYRVEATRAVPRVPNYFEDSTGNKRYRVAMRLKRVRQVDLPEAKRLLLEVVRNPKSFWTESLDGNGEAVKSVEKATSLAKLTDTCRNSSVW